MQHVPDGTCLFTRDRMLARSPLSLGSGRRVVDGHVLAEHLLVPDDANRPGEAPGGERLTELFADAVPGVSQHNPEGDALRSHAVEFFQGRLALGLAHLQGFWQVVAGKAQPRSNSSRWPEVQATCCTTIFQICSAVLRKDRRSSAGTVERVEP